ncbi:hypothetical protein [Streptomyces sp. NPDC050759]|uniref:hypothetical protein n=1 Tax=Streptomyces sp. NPDC050759 TaxID=3365635 RepID=UPI00378CE39F
MSGGVRYWNEETQRWEDGDGSGAATGPVTPPPPARPGAVPTWPPGVSGAADGASDGAPSTDGTATPTAAPVAPVWPPAAGSAGAEAAPDETVGAAAGSGSPEPSAEVAPGPPPPPSPPAGWPGTGGGSTWHGPGAAGAPGAPDGGWSSVEQLGGGSAPSAEWSGTSWSTAAQTAPLTAAQTAVTPPPSGTNRRLLWSVLGGVAAVGVAVTLVLTQVVGGGDEDDKAGDASPTPTGVVSQQSDPYESPTPSPTEDTASPLASPPELPAGYELYEDEEGFRIARPEGWSRTTVDSQYGIDVVNYRSTDGERRLQVYQVAEESPEASFKLYLSADTSKPDGFEKLDLQPVEEDGFTGERLEYRADSLSGEPDIGPWHVYDERFVAQDGFIYAIAAYGLESDGGQDELELLTTALSGFCAPYACDAASID